RRSKKNLFHKLLEKQDPRLYTRGHSFRSAAQPCDEFRVAPPESDDPASHRSASSTHCVSGRSVSITNCGRSIGSNTAFILRYSSKSRFSATCPSCRRIRAVSSEQTQCRMRHGCPSHSANSTTWLTWYRRENGRPSRNTL